MAGEHKGEVKVITECIDILKSTHIDTINDDNTRTIISRICKKLYVCTSLDSLLPVQNVSQPRYNEYKALLALAVYTFTENPVPDFVHFNEGYGVLNLFNTRQKYMIAYEFNPKSILKRIKFIIGVYYMMHISDRLNLFSTTWEDKLRRAIEIFNETYQTTDSSLLF